MTNILLFKIPSENSIKSYNFVVLGPSQAISQQANIRKVAFYYVTTLQNALPMKMRAKLQGCGSLFIMKQNLIN